MTGREPATHETRGAVPSAMDPLRAVVVAVALLAVGAFAFLAATTEREVDAGTAVGFVDESVAFAETRAELEPGTGNGNVRGDASPEEVTRPTGYAETGGRVTPEFPDPADKVELTEAQWRERLSPEQFRVLRDSGTERPFSSPLDDVKQPGWFVCAGCGNLLYETKTKFDSRTGWPSFWEPVAAANVVEEVEGGLDRRIEVRCARCDGHLGHVFDDGPRDETGLRYCMNGVAMDFLPKPDAE